MGECKNVCSPPHTVVALELAEGPLFISYPVDLEPTALREA
jgi:hypothetical protein